MSVEVPPNVAININTLSKVSKALATIQKDHVAGGERQVVLSNGETSIKVDKTVEAVFRGVEMGATHELIDDGQAHAVEMVRFAKHQWEAQ